MKKYLEGLSVCHFCHKELYENVADLRVFQTEREVRPPFFLVVV